MGDESAPAELAGLDLVRDSVVVRDAAWRVVFWNRASEDLYGWSSAQVLGQDARALFEIDTAEVERADRTLAATGHWTGLVRRRRADGHGMAVDVAWAPWREAGGNVVGVVETGRRMRLERQRDRRLRLLERRYGTLFRAMNAAFWELDVSAARRLLKDLGVDSADELRRPGPDLARELASAIRITDLNDVSTALFGEVQGEGRALSAFLPDESLPAFTDAVAAALLGRSGYSCQLRLRGASIQDVDVLLSACLAPDGLRQGTVTVGLIDMSDRVAATEELRRAKERYEYLFQYMPIALWQLNAEAVVEKFNALRAEGVTDLGRYLDAHPALLDELMDTLRVEEVNQSAVTLWGARDAEELRSVTRNWDESPGTFRRAMEARYRGEPVFQEEARFRTLDGRIVDALFTAARPGPPDRLNASIVGLIDITERTRAQQHLRRLQSEMAHATRISLLGELVASIAHEINQPLAAIIANGGAGLRWLDRPQPELQETTALLHRIVADPDRAADIIRRIRAMAAHREPELKRLDFSGVVREAVAFLQHEMRAHNATVLLDLDDDLPDVLGDRTQLQQVLVNLALNALQAMSGDRLRRVIRIRASRRREGGIQWSVEDSGPGVAESDLGSVFESFFSTKPDGLGIGLAMCRRIVEAHGGAIDVDNDSGFGGARFRAWLPAADGDAHDATAAPPPQRPAPRPS